jgi:hypothetical protein
MDMVYVTSLPNSGSTVIALIANSHPDMVSPGELFGPGGRRHGPEGPTCSCGQLLPACPFWSEVADRYKAQGHPWTPASWGLHYQIESHPKLSKLIFSRPGPSALRHRVFAALPSVGRHVRTLDDRNRTYAQLVTDVSGKRVLLDTSKEPERLAHLCRIAGIGMRAVHLVRDPRGYCNSRKKNARETVEHAARQWTQRNRYMARLAAALPPERRVRILYEDFCRDPQAVMDQTYALAGLASAPVPSDMRDVTHHLLGNRMRTRRDAEVTLDASWQEQLTQDELAAIRQIAGPLAKEYGYDL